MTNLTPSPDASSVLLGPVLDAHGQLAALGRPAYITSTHSPCSLPSSPKPAPCSVTGSRSSVRHAARAEIIGFVKEPHNVGPDLAELAAQSADLNCGIA